MTVKLSHERKVRSLAKKTLGSTRVGRAMRFEGAEARRGREDMRGVVGVEVGGWRGSGEVGVGGGGG